MGPSITWPFRRSSGLTCRQCATHVATPLMTAAPCAGRTGSCQVAMVSATGATPWQWDVNGEHFFDIHQNPGVGVSQAGPLLPCLMTHVHICSGSANRALSPEEVLTVTGTTGLFDETQSEFQTSFSRGRAAAHIARVELSRMAGNAVHSAVLGTCISYGLSRCIPVQTC